MPVLRQHIRAIGGIATPLVTLRTGTEFLVLRRIVVNTKDEVEGEIPNDQDLAHTHLPSAKNRQAA